MDNVCSASRGKFAEGGVRSFRPPQIGYRNFVAELVLLPYLGLFYYVCTGEGVKTPCAFPIFVMLRSFEQRGGGVTFCLKMRT